MPFLVFLIGSVNDNQKAGTNLLFPRITKLTCQRTTAHLAEGQLEN